MNSMGERLQAALTFRGRDAPWLIAKIGMSKGTVYNILDNTTKPEKVRGSTIAKICDALAISAEWLQFNRGEMAAAANGYIKPISNHDATLVDTPSTRSVQIVGAAVVDENGFWKELQESAGNEFYATHTDDPNAFIVRIASRRYAPAIRAGQGVLVEPGAIPKLGRMVLVTMVDGRHAIRDYHSHEHGIWVFTNMLDANDFLEIPDKDVLRVESIRYPLWLD